jgi:hypothetical protein
VRRRMKARRQDGVVKKEKGKLMQQQHDAM